jgi:ankyrin repeat protein
LIQSEYIDINELSQDSAKQTAVMLAAQQGYLHCVKLLIDARADLTIVDSQQQSCVQLCSLEKGRGCLRAIQNGLSNTLTTSTNELSNFI